MNNIMKQLNDLNIDVGDFQQEWKPIHGFKRVIDDLYEVSNDGLVRDIKTKELRNQKIATKVRHPYYAVSLKHTSGKLEWVLVHQLVGYFFVDIPDELKGHTDIVIDHLDNNGLNNLYTNLSWKTRAANITASSERNDIMRHDNHDIIDFLKLHEICKELEKCESYKEILENVNLEYNINNISFIKKIAEYSVDSNRCYKLYNFYNGIRPTEAQTDIVSKLNIIRDMIALGKTNGEIVDELWPGLKKSTRKSRVRTVFRIRTGQIYNNC